MNKGKKGKSQDRVLKVLKLLIEEPEKYTKKDLASLFEVDEDTIQVHFRILRKNGFDIKDNGYPDYQYYIENVTKRNDLTIIKKNGTKRI